MEKVNGESGITQQSDITVTEFWDMVYLPYTLEEAEAISNVLIDNPPAQVVFCLAAFLSLRPGKISAVKVEDVEWNDDGLSLDSHSPCCVAFIRRHNEEGGGPETSRSE